MESISFQVRAEPKGQPRAKASRAGGFIRMYTPPTADSFKAAVQAAAIEAGLLNKNLEGPIALRLVFRMPRPKSHFGTGKNSSKLKDKAAYWHTTKPDLDNIEKALKDALSDIRAWRDDCQVCDVQKSKIYVEGMDAPVSDVTISTL
jgi:Holliday junction resolvase RusA-like endonuclease